MESTILHVQQGEIILNILTGNISYIFNMKQNDMIYIKKGIKHAVIGITPRFLVSYGIFD
jgi:oxalate decarboxylase/phosphoglucose isomerase-like protein (cupin superfamily)